MGDRGKTGRNLYWEIGSRRTTLEGPRLQANVAVCLPIYATKSKGISGWAGVVPGGNMRARVVGAKDSRSALHLVLHRVRRPRHRRIASISSLDTARGGNVRSASGRLNIIFSAGLALPSFHEPWPSTATPGNPPTPRLPVPVRTCAAASPSAPALNRNNSHPAVSSIPCYTVNSTS